MLVQVYHNDFATNAHVLVARVTTPFQDVTMALQYAFERTNNFKGSWSKPRVVEFEGNEVVNEDYSENVVVVAALPVVNGEEYGLRSSMVGDKFVVNGREYEVTSVGFREVLSGSQKDF